MFKGKKYTMEISDHTYFTYVSESQIDDMWIPTYVGPEQYDNETWQREHLIQLCTTIKNSYYFENSEVLEKIIYWAYMELEAENDKKDIENIESSTIFPQ